MSRNIITSKLSSPFPTPSVQEGGFFVDIRDNQRSVDLSTGEVIDENNIRRTISLNTQSVNQETDPYTSKIIKLIPADIIGVYLGVFNIIKSSSENQGNNRTLQWIVFGLILLITPFYLKKVAGVISTRQIVFSTISFVVWAFSLGGPLDGEDIGGYTIQFLGALFLPIYTLVIPLFYTGNSK
ncbi:hypothetical protein [Leadbetterella sp. DM7]|uniref:hypothetical protein n=1 Tax=Leadbetterella sp. DM7 TaxID=3235085 RepID=UPI00349E70D4